MRQHGNCRMNARRRILNQISFDSVFQGGFDLCPTQQVSGHTIFVKDLLTARSSRWSWSAVITRDGKWSITETEQHRVARLSHRKNLERLSVVLQPSMCRTRECICLLSSSGVLWTQKLRPFCSETSCIRVFSLKPWVSQNMALHVGIVHF